MVRFLILVLLLSCSFVTNALAADVRKIDIQGVKRVGEEAIRKNILTTIGTLNRRTLSEDVKRLYNLGFFTSIDVVYDENKEVLTFIVKERPTILQIAFEGNSEKKTEDLKAEIATKELTYLDHKQIQDDLRKLEDFYDARGFFLAEVDYEVEEVRPGEVKVKFVLKEGREVLIRRVNIIGNTIFTDAELKKVMRTKEGNWLSFLSDAGTFQEGIFAQDRAILTQFYGQQGYIKVKISEPTLTLSADKKHLYLSFRIEEGDQYKIGNFNVSGELIKDKEELLKLIKIKNGEIADSLKIRRDVEKLAEVYGEDGYFYVNVIPRTVDRQEEKTVDIDFTIEKGPKVYIDRINISGNTSTRDKVIRREMRLNEGDLYNASKLRLSRFRIERTSYFEEVNITTPRGSADNKIDVNIDVTERSTGSFSIGAGFNSIESFQFIGQIQKRNLFGLGYDISLQARLGGRTQTFSLRFVDPYFLDSRVGFSFSAFNSERQFINFQQASTGGSIGFSFPVYEKGRERITFGIQYSLINESIEDIRRSIENLFDDGLTSSLTFSLTRDTRNRVFQPTQGTLIRGSAEFADGAITGDNTFGKFLFESSVFFPIISPKSRFIPGSVLQFRLRTDYITGFGEDIPLFERFFPGGILSIRGFELRSLGPQIQIASDASPSSLVTDDFPIGGNKQLIFNTEFIFPIFAQAGIRGVVFYDIGNAFAEGELFDVNDLRHSTGFGIRWFSPIGPLRFEWGFPLDRRDDESSVVFDFTIGSLF